MAIYGFTTQISRAQASVRNYISFRYRETALLKLFLFSVDEKFFKSASTIFATSPQYADIVKSEKLKSKVRITPLFIDMMHIPHKLVKYKKIKKSN